MAFTIQRAAVIHSPLKDKFKSKKSAWKTVASITIVGIILNSWVPFLFKIQTQSQENKQYCDIKKEYSKEYFQITIIYISLIMLIPIIVIFIGNSIIGRGHGGAVYYLSRTNSMTIELLFITFTKIPHPIFI